MGSGGRKKIRSIAEEREYVSLSLPSIERRSLMESGMRHRTTRLDVAIVVVFVLVLVAILGVFLEPVLAKLIAHLPDLFNSTGG